MRSNAGLCGRCRAGGRLASKRKQANKQAAFMSDVVVVVVSAHGKEPKSLVGQCGFATAGRLCPTGLAGWLSLTGGRLSHAVAASHARRLLGSSGRSSGGSIAVLLLFGPASKQTDGAVGPLSVLLLPRQRQNAWQRRNYGGPLPSVGQSHAQHTHKPAPSPVVPEPKSRNEPRMITFQWAGHTTGALTNTEPSIHFAAIPTAQILALRVAIFSPVCLPRPA